MRKSVLVVLVAGVMLSITSCEMGAKKEATESAVEEVAVDTVEVKEEVEEVVETPKKKEVKQQEPQEEVQPKQEAQKVEEVPQEIGASPDAVYMLDDSETETSPKFPDGEKAMKKLLKKALRKGQKGEKARFKASIVIKADGTVGRVQFTECGYKDEYKPEIIEALRALPAFTPGTKDGKPVDSWYYLNYKR